MLEPMQRPTFAVPRLSLRAAILISLAIVAVVAWVHFWMGRTPICKCGSSSSGTAVAAMRRSRST